MIKRFCDKCSEEAKDQDFSCEVVVREIKRQQSFPIISTEQMDVRPQLSEKYLHFCRKCAELNKII